MRTIYVYNPETQGGDLIEFTEDAALSLHRQMWTDMQKKLGDNPSPNARENFKWAWCEQHFPHQDIINNCLLCEYTEESCNDCPIRWPNTGHKSFGFYCCRINDVDTDTYDRMPISRLLALPERIRDEQE